MTAPIVVPPAADPAVPPTPAPGPAPAVPPVVVPPATDPAGGAPAQTVEQLQAMITTLRAENARDRTAGKTAAANEARDALIKQLNTALGMPGGETTDPAELARQVQAGEAQRRSLAAENAILRGAHAHGGDAGALVDSRTFMVKVEGLDPTSATYAADLDALIKTTVESAPRYRLAAGATPPVPPPPSGDFGGGQQQPATPAPGSAGGVEGMRDLLSRQRREKRDAAGNVRP